MDENRKNTFNITVYKKAKAGFANHIYFVCT